MKKLIEIVRESCSFVKRNAKELAISAVAVAAFTHFCLLPTLNAEKSTGKSSTKNPVSLEKVLDDVFEDVDHKRQSKHLTAEYYTRKSKHGIAEYYTDMSKKSLKYSHNFNDKNYNIEIFIIPKDDDFDNLEAVSIKFEEVNETSKQPIKGYVLKIGKHKGKILTLGNMTNKYGEESKEYLSNEEFKQAYKKFLEIHEDYFTDN